MRRKEPPLPSPADALRAAIRSVQDALGTAPPDKAGGMARALAGMARDLKVMERKTPEERALENEEMHRQFSAEVERIIRLRTHERVNTILDQRGLDPDEPLPATDYVSCVTGQWP